MTKFIKKPREKNLQVNRLENEQEEENVNSELSKQKTIVSITGEYEQECTSNETLEQ